LRLRASAAICLLEVALWPGPGADLEARERQPLQKKNIQIGQPAPYAPELEGYDKKGDPIYWDPKPHVVPLGDGKYALKWIGHSGRELTLVYQRPDVVDVIVEADAVLGQQNQLMYKYLVRNLKTSKQNLGGFEVRTFTTAVKPQSSPSFYATDPAHIRQDIDPVRDGLWIRFAPLGSRTQIRPGQRVVFELTSPARPGILECRVHADTLTMMGVGEEPPGVLEDLYLGRDAWPHGYTIGPDERLGKMSVKERSNYLVQHLPQMLELGWIENQKVMQWYETNLKAGKVAEVRARAEADFKKNLITSEVLALMTYLTR
jgi:hypothetical protein